MNILDRVRLVVSKNDSSPVVNEDRLVRSIHYININQNILDRVRLVVCLNDEPPVVNVDRLGRSIHYTNINQNILDRVTLVVSWNELSSIIKNFNSGRLEIVKLEIFLNDSL